MSKTTQKTENVAGIEYYGFEDSDLFPGATTSEDKPIPDMQRDNLMKKDEKTPLSSSTEKKDFKKSEPLISQQDITEIIRAHNPHSDYVPEPQKRESNVIKSGAAESKSVMTPVEFQNELSRSMGLGKSDWAEIAQDIEENDILSDDFQDFIEMPKISGDERNFVGKNLISGSMVHSSHKKVEIADDSSFHEDEHNTSIEINRSESGDIESISVYCKCGEVTQIKFNYQDTSVSNENEYLKSSSGLDSLNLEEVRMNRKK